MGLAPAPGINDESIKEILRLLQCHEQVCLTDFVDDMLGSGTTQNEASDKLAAAVRFFLCIGIPVSCKPNGIRPPSQRQSWVGW
eukprot:9393607-Pyramimonas_sp.AAC.1